jgi:hypothetical protein
MKQTHPPQLSLSRLWERFREQQPERARTDTSLDLCQELKAGVGGESLKPTIRGGVE